MYYSVTLGLPLAPYEHIVAIMFDANGSIIRNVASLSEVAAM